jgi:tricorn protease
MRHGFVRWFALVCPLLAATAVSAEALPPEHFLRFPDIRGDAVVFTCEGDLWLGSLSGGSARRITTDEGVESHARFSPDGKWLAFTGQYDGGDDVYLMPVEGGAPKRLTWDPGRAEVCGWTPDGQNVVFRSRRDTPLGRQRDFIVSIRGGLPRPLPMPEAGRCAFSPDGKRIAYTPYAMEGHNWKRYQGGLADDIWLYDTATSRYTRLTDWAGSDMYPCWAGDTLYFVSDRSGRMELWAMNPPNGEAWQMTRHNDYDVKWPATDGRRIIYQCGAGLETYDIATRIVQPAKFDLSSDRIHARRRTVAPAKWLTDAAIGPTGKRVAFAARGDIVTIPAGKGAVRSIACGSASRDKMPAWSPDGRWLAFVSDRSGEQQLYITPADGSGEARAVTSLERAWFLQPRWSPDSRSLVFGTEDQSLYLAAVSDKPQVTRIDTSRRGTFGSYRFSPDSRFIAYEKPEDDRSRQVYIYDTRDKTSRRVTTTMAGGQAPAFSRDGKLLYFLSDRNATPRIDTFDYDVYYENPTKVYALALARDTKSPFLTEDDEEPVKEAEKPGAKPQPGAKKGKPDDKEKTPAEEEEPAETVIDFDGLAGRLIEVPVEPGRYITVEPAGDRLLLLNPSGKGGDDDDGDNDGPAADNALLAFDLKEKKTTTISDSVSGFELSADGKKLLIRSGNRFQTADADIEELKPDKDIVDISAWTIEVDPVAEWRQMFEEAWRVERDFMYSPNLHGVDWQAVHDRYAALLPAVGSRGELTEILGEMIGELNVSHSYTGGGDTGNRVERRPIAGLGAELVADEKAGRYRIGRIYPGDGYDAASRSPLLDPGLGVKEGDYLLAVAGESLTLDKDVNSLLAGRAGKVVALVVNDKPSSEGARTAYVKPLDSDRPARDAAWVESRRAYVASKDGRIGYLYLSDMGDNSLRQFAFQYYHQLDKDGLIVDVRNNGGGNTSSIILDRLMRKPYVWFQPRYGMADYEHPTAFPGRMVCLINAGTGSDGENFAEGFRKLGLGKVVGSRTWGGLVGISGTGGLVDGGFVTVPQYAAWTPEGWTVEGRGVIPDIEAADDPAAVAAGGDPQLDAAIAQIQRELRENPVVRPKTPPYEDRSGLTPKPAR